MPRLLLALLVALSLSAAEIPLSEVQYGPAGADRSRERPLVIPNDDGFLVIWSENQFDVYYAGEAGRAYDAEGNPLQITAIPIYSRDVVWTGESYLAIRAIEWDRRRPFYFPVPQIRTQRLHRDGTLAGPELGFFEGMTGATLLSMAWNGTHVGALVTLEHKRLLRFDVAGQLVSDTQVDADVVAVAPNGAGFFLLRGAQPRVIAGDHGRYAIAGPSSIPVIDASGAEIDSVPIATRTLTWDGGAWHTAYVDAEGRVCMATFTSSTDVRRDCRVIADARDPAVGVLPRREFLAWEVGRQIVTDSGVASIAPIGQLAADTTLDATGLLVAWIENGIQLDGLRHDGTRRGRFFIPDTRAHFVQLAEGFVIWRAAGEIYGMRLDEYGAPLHPVLALGMGVAARVLRNGDGWIVLRLDPSSEPLLVKATTISGQAVVTGEHVVATDSADVAFAAAGDGFLVVTRTALQRIDRNGVPVGAPVPFDGEFSRRVACSARECLIVTGTRSIVVDHHGRTLRDWQPLQLDAPLAEVKALADGTLRIFTNPYGAGGGVEVLGRRTWFFYSRDGRVYLRDLPPRSRAVRH